MFDRLIDLLVSLQAAVRRAPSFKWAVVTDNTPLTVHIEGDENPTIGPATLVAGLVVDDRVMVLTQNNRVTIIGRGGG